MKKIIFLSLALPSVFLVACKGNDSNMGKTEGNTVMDVSPSAMAASASPMQENASDSVEDDMDSDSPDAVSGATNVANEPMFNGILIVPPQSQATVSLSMGGIVKNTSLLVGQYVKEGEIIAVLDNPDFIVLQQNYLDAMAQLEFLEKEYVRQQNLVSQDAASRKRLEQSKADYLSAKTKAEALGAQLGLLGVEPASLMEQGLKPQLEVKAPLSGYVTNTEVNLGKYINPGEPICEIIDKKSLLLQLTVYEKDLAKLEDGIWFDFQVNGMDGKTFGARLISVDQKVDEQSRSTKVYARLETTDNFFRPGMYVSARIRKGH